MKLYRVNVLTRAKKTQHRVLKVHIQEIEANIVVFTTSCLLKFISQPEGQVGILLFLLFLLVPAGR